ncbi:hypothetical protein AADZ86_18050 [Colwelliaceae bacterium BS250]
MANALADKVWLKRNELDLQNKINQGLLPHALLLIGSNCAGQDELGVWLAHKLICQNSAQGAACGQCKGCHLLKAHSHPDLQVINNGEKTIGVDIVRLAGGFLQKTAHLGDVKVVLVNACENMTEAAANALLKTLEEPTDNSFLILTCNDVDLLLPTIVSRCSQIKVQPPIGNELAELIDDKQLMTEFSNINQFAELTDPQVQQSYIEFNQTLLNWLQTFNESESLNKAFANNSHCLRWLSDCLHQLLRMQSGWREALSEHAVVAVDNKFTNEQLWACLTLVNNANRQIKLLTQANKNFTIEALLVDIEQVLN